MIWLNFGFPQMFGHPHMFGCLQMFGWPPYVWMPHASVCPHAPLYRFKRGFGSGKGSRRGWVFSVCGISIYKQVKFLGKILQHCCGTSFLSSSGLGEGPGGLRGLSKGGHWIMVYEYGYEYGYEKWKDQRTESQCMEVHTNIWGCIQKYAHTSHTTINIWSNIFKAFVPV